MRHGFQPLVPSLTVQMAPKDLEPVFHLLPVKVSTYFPAGPPQGLSPVLATLCLSILHPVELPMPWSPMWIFGDVSSPEWP